jgi:hypothetical protein
MTGEGRIAPVNVLGGRGHRGAPIPIFCGGTVAGTIAAGRGRHWSAAGWLFDWTVEFLAANVEDGALQAELAEVVEENLGWLGLDDYGSEAGRGMRELLRTRLGTAAAESFPTTMAGRAAALALLEELAAMA